jgi:hypothetical protein
MDDLDDLPPEDFVAGRDALARELKAAGKVKEAAGVKKLRKPTVQTWIAQQVRRHHGDVVAALKEASRAVAAAQETAITGGDRDPLREATAARKDAVRDVGRAVEQVLARNGRPAHHRDEVLTAIETAVTAEVAGGTFGLRDDLELPARVEPARDLEAERRAAEAKAEIEAAQARVDRARAELDKAESGLAAVLERHGGIEGDA